jgi:hypothetical protein
VVGGAEGHLDEHAVVMLFTNARRVNRKGASQVPGLRVAANRSDNPTLRSVPAPFTPAASNFIARRHEPFNSIAWLFCALPELA